MNSIKLIRTADAVERLSEYTGVTIPEILDILTGHCWDEEGASEILDSYVDELEEGL